MPRPCGPCSDPRRNELDRRLLEKDLNGESFRRIAADFGHSETALRRHLSEHLRVDLENVHRAKEKAKAEALEQVKTEELESTRNAAVKGETARLRASASLLDQLRALREEGWQILEAAKKDPRLALGAIQRLASLLELQAEIEGKIRSGQLNVNVNQTTTIYESSEWSEVGAALAEILAPYPELKASVAKRLLELAREGDNR